MTKNQKIATLENRVAELEKIITKSVITLTDDIDSSKTVVISFLDGNFKITKIQSTIHQEKTLIINQDNL